MNKSHKSGRPPSPMPPRIDASPEEIARAVFAAPPDLTVDDDLEYRCVDCGRIVAYPETLYNDGRCEGCHAIA